jgi:hypothetical protein
MKVWFSSFADSKYSKTKTRIYDEAVNSKFFDHIKLFGEEDLSSDMLNYCNTNSRGFGYWSWKPTIVGKCLDNMEAGDILVYCDIGCIINPKGIRRFNEYKELLREVDMLAFQTPHLECQYCKMDLVVQLNAERFLNTGQVAATSFIIKKTPNTVDIINTWIKLASDYHLIDDSPSIIQNHPDFIDHRHDQSIFSLICKTKNVLLLQNEIWMALDQNGYLFDDEYPFHGARLKY